MWLAPYGESVARSGQNSLAQGFTLGNSPQPELALKGPERWLAQAFSSPFRAKRLFWLTQGKPGYAF